MNIKLPLRVVPLLFFLSLIGLNAQTTPVFVDDDFTAATGGWGVTHFATIQTGIDGVADGGTVYIAAGTYTEDATTPAYPGKKVSFIGETDGSGNPRVTIKGSLYLDNADGMSITDIRFEVDSKELLTLINTNGFTIKNCVFDGNIINGNNGEFLLGKNGIKHVSGPNGNSDIIIEYCLFTNGLYVGIDSRITNLTVKYSMFQNLKSGINQKGGNNLVVENCYFQVEAQAPTSDTYGIRFAADVTEDLTVTGSTFLVDKNGFTASPPDYHSAVIVRANSGGTLNVNNSSVLGEVVNLSSVNINAENNWWGDIDPSDNFSGSVDYSPWWGADYVGDSHTSPWTWHTNDSVQDAVDAASAGDIVNIAAGTYTEDVAVDKSLTINGEGVGSTTLQPTASANTAFNVTADNVTITDLLITHPTILTYGISLNSTSNLTLQNVNITNIGGATAAANGHGIYIYNSFSGLTVIDCFFSSGYQGEYSRGIGVFAPNHLTLSDFNISGSTFEYFFVGVYLRSAIDGLDVNTSTFGPFELSDCTAAVAGVYIGDGDDDNFDISNVMITGNTFVDYGRGVYVWNYGANSAISDFEISGNTFTNSISSSAVRFILGLTGLENYSISGTNYGINIDNNDFNQNSDVGANVGLVDLRTYDATLTACDVDVTNNEMVFSGDPYTYAMYGIKFTIAGDGFYNTTISGNSLDCGNTGGSGNQGSSAIAVTHYGDNYTWAHDLELNISDNQLTAFDQGISIYDAVNSQYGNLPTGTDININNNDLFGNTLYGIQNGTGEIVDAKFNWWGDASGPSGEGSGTGDAVSVNVLYSPWIGNLPDAPHDVDNPWTFYIDDSNPDALKDLMSNPNLLDGDEVIVDGGTHNAIVITKAITLIGTNGATVESGSPAISINASNITIDGITFNFNNGNWAIKSYGDYEDIIVKNCIFNNIYNAMPGYGISNDANGDLYYIDATENNNWGDVTGPNHSSNAGGLGVIITDYVIYDLMELSAPVNSISGISLFPTFTWTAFGGGPLNYYLIVSENQNLTAPLYNAVIAGNDTTFTATESTVGFPLTNNKNYYWAVVVKDPLTNTIYASSTNYFKTVAGVSINLSAPSNNMQLYAFDPAQFTWWLGQAQGTLKFYLQILEGSPTAGEWATAFETEVTTPGTNTHFYDNISNIYKGVNGLDGGTVYSWRVVAYYDDGATANEFDWADRVVKYSTVFKFTTKGGAVKAYPSWPIGGNTIYNLLPTYYWYTMQYDAAATYTVYVATTNDGDADLTDETLVSTLSAGINVFVNQDVALLPSTTYYWQVVTTNGSATNYSSIASFKTYDAPGIAPTVPTLSYPTGGMDIYTTSPTLYWYINGYNSGTLTFEVFVKVGAGAWNTKGTTQDTYLQINGLVAGTTYDWKVVVSAAGYADVESNEATFKVVGGSSSSIVLNWPTGNALLYTNTPTLSWGVDGSTLGWSGYYVKWKEGSTSANWATESGTTINDINETYYSFTGGLNYGSKYYWAVALYDGTNVPTDANYVESSFTITGGANNAQVTLSAPSNNANNVSQNPTFYWYTNGTALGVDKYMLEYSKTELFTDHYVDTVETQYTYASAASSLEEGATYWWRVSVSDDGGANYTLASQTWKFTVDPGAMAVMPLVGSPANRVTIGTNSPSLSWYLPAQSSSALSYEVEIADNADFSNATTYQNISQLNAQVANLEDGEYFWRARSKTGSSTSSYSNIGNFKVGNAVTGVEDEEELPLTYSVDQNYPNPFNPTTTISYSLPEAGYVTVTIYDMLGREVRSLVSGELKSGRHSISWRGDNNYGQKVVSGTYIYRITAGEFVQAKKMILLK